MHHHRIARERIIAAEVKKLELRAAQPASKRQGGVSQRRNQPRARAAS